MKGKKILIITDTIDAEHSSGSKANIAFIKNLITADYQITLIHYSGICIDIKGARCILAKKNRVSISFILSHFVRFFQRKFGINANKYIESLLGFSFTFFNDVQSIYKSLQKLGNYEPDIVITLSYASSFRPHAAMLKKNVWHNKWLAYVHDPFPMHSYPRPYDWVEPGHQHKRNFFVDITKKARWIGYPSQLLANWMESYYHDAKNKAVVIPHQVNKETYQEPKYMESTNIWDNTFVVLHAGALMSARNPYGLLQAFIQLLNEYPHMASDMKLLFVGRDSIYSDTINELHDTYPQIEHSKDNMSFNEVLMMQRNACVNVILEAKGPISPFLPGKFAHCIQSNRPILLLGPYYSESRRLLGTDYEYYAEIDDIQKIKTCLHKLYTQWVSNGKRPCLLNRPDMDQYLSADYLKNIIDSLS
jgi:glycosyltransferase involved in cell wall biosynthesis